MKRCILLFVIMLVSSFSNVQAAQVTVAWNVVTPTPSKYRVYQRTATQQYNYTAPVFEGVGISQAVITGLVDGTAYYFVAKAVMGADESCNTDEVMHVATEVVNTSRITLRFDGVWYKRSVYEYYGTTAQKFKCSWTPNGPVAEGYEVRLYSIDRNSETIIANGRVLVPQITFNLPKTGHYYVKVRACRSNYTDCSEWALSTNLSDAVVGTEPGAWIIFGNIASPGAIIIN